MAKSKGGKKKRVRAHKFIHPELRARVRIKSEINKVTKKIKKLLWLHDEGRKRTNCTRAIRADDGSEEKRVSHSRLQGMKEGSERHQKLKKHLSSLKQALKRQMERRTVDTCSKVRL